MDEDALERAKQRIAQAASRRTEPADFDAALERAREGVEALAAATAELEAGLPERVGDAVRESVASQARPMARQLGEIRGLMNQVLRRLERIEGDALSERHARVDDLALLVDLVMTGWQGVDERLTKIEQHLHAPGGAVVYRIEERRPAG